METYRDVMEKKLGRKLKKEEIVHHIDGNQSNDCPENLGLTTQKEHPTKKHWTKEQWEEEIRQTLEIRKGIEAREFQYHLDILFTPRQKQILFKRLYREKLTKTETEMYSRTIKKVVRSLADPQLQKIAEMLIIWG